MASVQNYLASKNLNELIAYHLSLASEQVQTHITQSINRDIERSKIIKSRGKLLELLDQSDVAESATETVSQLNVSLTEYISEIKAVSNEIANISLTTAAHQLIATTEQKLNHREVINPNNFRILEVNGQSIGVQFVESKDGFKLVTFDAIHSNQDAESPITAYLIIETHLSSITSIIESPTELSNSHELILMYLPNRSTKAKILVPPRFANGQRNIDVGLNPFSLVTVNNEKTIKEYVDYRGSEVIGIVEHLPEYGLAYIIKYDQEDAYMLVNDLRQYIAVITLVIVLLVWAMSFLISAKIIKPFENIIHATNNILTNNSARIKREANGLKELENLGLAINFLADRMRLALNSANLNQGFVLEAISEGVLIIDSYGVIIKANPSMDKISGYDHEELIGKNINVLLNEHDQYLIMGLIYKYLNEPTSGEQAEPKQVNMTRKNRTEIITSLTVTRLEHEHENLYLVVMNDVTEKVNYQKKLEHLALHDSLTDLPKMLLASDRLDSAINSAKRNRHKVGVMFIDLDHFKPVNDEYGHASGDMVIRIIATRLKDSIRECDTVARVGGDEFVVIAAEISDAQQLNVLAQKLRYQIEMPIDIGQAKVKVGASIGMSVFPDSSLNKEELMSFADEAMYKVKAEGRSACELHHSCSLKDNDTTVTPFPHSKR